VSLRKNINYINVFSILSSFDSEKKKKKEKSKMLNTSILYSIHDEWTGHALASCRILKWIGGYLCFTFICGIVLNAIILFILLQTKHRRSPIDIFIIALCFSDLLAALLGIPLPLTSNLACR
jgi:hypothetical protein